MPAEAKERVELRAAPDEVAAFRRAAAAEGRSLAAWLREAARARLKEDRRG